MNCWVCGRKAIKVNLSTIRNGQGVKTIKEYVCRLHASMKHAAHCDVNKIRIQEYGFSE